MNAQEPDVAKVLGNMRASIGALPEAMGLAGEVDQAMVREQARSSLFAMPAEGALDPETRTLVYLASAISSSNHACIAAMASKAGVQQIPTERLLEAFHIARYALATRAVGDAQPLLELLKERPEVTGSGA